MASELCKCFSVPPPRSAFFIFCSEFRPKVKGESPGLSIGDVAKRLGEMWNSTAAEDKQPFEKKAAKLKEKYEKVRVKCERRLSSSVTAVYFCVLTLVHRVFAPPSQDIAAYRAKGKPGSGAPAKAPAKAEKKDDDDDDDDEDEEEEEDDDDEDDD